ncbi:hypothetical protein [Paenibacillus tyrfis]|uniref:hypothetical protein n=1 Tax=Paenibacillus tyrfis TaxID=1501230 RepID=UPI00209D8EA6|nr:hypothetical protein [Paenibacillus tyrfis]MCP1309435.1 hypothetical protein [Paenibacillus tyrfis]
MSWTDSLGRLAAQLTSHKPSLYPDEELDDLADIKIGKLSLDAIEGERKTYALTVKAGLHLFNESLEKSHALSQEIHNHAGSYWHGIMHRMEGDYPNAAYWFRMARSLPIYAELAERAYGYVRTADLQGINNTAFRERLEEWASGSGWDPCAFNELVERHVTRTRDEQAEEMLKHIQWLEMRLLLEYGYVQSGGGGSLLESP